MILFLSFILFLFDCQSHNIKHVEYEHIELNIVLGKTNKEMFRQFVFWKDSCSQGYSIVGQSDFIDGPIKIGDYYVIIVQHKKKYYYLKSKNFTSSKTNYDIETYDLKRINKTRKYNVRLW